MRQHRDLATLRRCRAPPSGVRVTGRMRRPTNGEGFQAYPARRALYLFATSTRLATARTFADACTGRVQFPALPIAFVCSQCPPPSLWHFRVEQGCWSAPTYAKGSPPRKYNSRAVWRLEDEFSVFLAAAVSPIDSPHRLRLLFFPPQPLFSHLQQQSLQKLFYKMAMLL